MSESERKEVEKAALELKRILGKQSIQPYGEAIHMIRALRSIDNTSVPGSSSFTEYNAFMYGYISGIKAERARRKRGIR